MYYLFLFGGLIMKLTIIGCWHAYPKQGEATSGYLLEYDNYHLLIDCGSGVVSQLQTFVPVEELDAVILSHYHHDHMTDVGVLQYASLINGYQGKTKVPLPIYGHNQDKEKFNQLSYPPHVVSIPYQPNKPIDIVPFTISFLQTKHPVPCYAMRIVQGKKTFVYTADTSYMEELAEFAHNCDLLLAESSTYEDQDLSKFGHMTSKEAATLAAKANAKQLVLTHLPHFGDVTQLVEEAKKYYKGTVQLAAPGGTISFME